MNRRVCVQAYELPIEYPVTFEFVDQPDGKRVITGYLLEAPTKLPYDPGRETEKALKGIPTKYATVTEDTSQGFVHKSIELGEPEEEG
jgi:hypothetical protein